MRTIAENDLTAREYGRVQVLTRRFHAEAWSLHSFAGCKVWFGRCCDGQVVARLLNPNRRRHGVTPWRR